MQMDASEPETQLVALLRGGGIGGDAGQQGDQERGTIRQHEQSLTLVVLDGAGDGELMAGEFIQQTHDKGEGGGFLWMFHQGEDEYSPGGGQAEIAVDDPLGDGFQMQRWTQGSCPGERFKIFYLDDRINRQVRRSMERGCTSGTSITLALTGASGAVYGLRLAEALLLAGQAVDVLLSTASRTVLARECGLNVQGDGDAVVRAFRQWSSHPGAADVYRHLRHHSLMDWDSPLASGSGGRRRMVICPCSMGTLAAVAMGLSDNLIERAADVVIKERGELILVPRETPLSAIHLEHMLRLTRMGVMVLPAAPGFYHQPQKVSDLVDFIVARILDQLGVAQRFMPAWGR